MAFFTTGEVTGALATDGLAATLEAAFANFTAVAVDVFAGFVPPSVWRTFAAAVSSIVAVAVFATTFSLVNCANTSLEVRPSSFASSLTRILMTRRRARSRLSFRLFFRLLRCCRFRLIRCRWR